MIAFQEIKRYAKRPVSESDILFLKENCHLYTPRELAVTMKRTRKTIYDLLKQFKLNARNLNTERVDLAKAQKLIPKPKQNRFSKPKQKRLRMTRFPLTEDQQDFIRQSHTVLTVREISKHLGVERYPIERFMRENSIETLPISLKKAKRFEHVDGIFNYNLPKESTWLV